MLRDGMRNEQQHHLRDGDIEPFLVPVLHEVLESDQRLFERGLLPDGVVIDVVLVDVCRHVYHADESAELVVDAYKPSLVEAALCGVFPIDSCENRRTWSGGEGMAQQLKDVIATNMWRRIVLVVLRWGYSVRALSSIHYRYAGRPRYAHVSPS